LNELLIQSKKYYNDFNEADGKIGDGDLGITIQNGFQEIINNKDNFH
jgi:dihydroxyacetone kinase-like protein